MLHCKFQKYMFTFQSNQIIINELYWYTKIWKCTCWPCSPQVYFPLSPSCLWSAHVTFFTSLDGLDNNYKVFLNDLPGLSSILPVNLSCLWPTLFVTHPCICWTYRGSILSRQVGWMTFPVCQIYVPLSLSVDGWCWSSVNDKPWHCNRIFLTCRGYIRLM